MNEIILTSMIRRGAFDSARLLQQVGLPATSTGMHLTTTALQDMEVELDERTVQLSEQLHKTMADLASGNVESALQ